VVTLVLAARKVHRVVAGALVTSWERGMVAGVSSPCSLASEVGCKIWAE
jgi:hypothetical protein